MLGSPPLIVHIIFRLDVGGLENGLVNLINRMDPDAYRHAIVCLQGYTDFRERLDATRNVAVLSLDKKAGKDIPSYARLWRLLRDLNPDIVHTRNLPALDSLFPAYIAGARRLVHGEHGWDMIDLQGTNRRYRWLRRLSARIVSRYIALSTDLEAWLTGDVGIDAEKVVRIVNGVDTARFFPGRSGYLKRLAGFPADAVVVGTVGRMQEVKDPLNLARAFTDLVAADPVTPARLAMIGDGEKRAEVEAWLERAGCRDKAWLPGRRDDIPELLRAMDVFVLPSLREGISNTVLEAMSSGLPVVATAVGGNPDLVDRDTGILVPPRDPAALAAAIKGYVDAGELRRQHGDAARARVEREFSIERMVDAYATLYDDLMGA